MLLGCGRFGFGPEPGLPTDDATTTSDGAIDASPAAVNRVFATSTAYSGAIGGLAGADAICQMHATQAGLPGTFVAFLSTTTKNAKDRLGAARGWIRTDGLPFADTQSSLFAGVVYFPVRLDEHGTSLGDTENVATSVWTGTTAAGVYDSAIGACSDWTSTGAQGRYGTTLGGTENWVQEGLAICSQTYHLFCFQIDHQTPVVPVRQGRLAFMSSAWASGGGIASADARCAADAAAAGLPGTYHALLASTGITAASRFDTAGERWVRVDGTPVFDPASMLSSGMPPLAPLDLSASGAYGTIATWAFTGASATNVAGLATSTCNGWTATVSSASGASGLPAYAGIPSIYWVDNGCNYATGPIYCLQD